MGRSAKLAPQRTQAGHLLGAMSPQAPQIGIKIGDIIFSEDRHFG
jgi:hypothetical protein